jgi:DNA invertase Pin-like site-specific DNA recombinase
MNVALYARVSTKDKGQDPEMQLTELREFAAKRGWQVAGEFVDIGVSGSKDSRPQLDAMMRLAKSAQAGRDRRLEIGSLWPQSPPSSGCPG